MSSTSSRTSAKRTSTAAKKSSDTKPRIASPAIVSPSFPDDLWSWGIDLSSTRVDVGFVQPHATDHTWINGILAPNQERPARLHYLYHRLVSRFLVHLESHPAACVIIEEPFGKGTKTTLSAVLGVIELALYTAGCRVPIICVNQNTWRKSVIGAGNATKDLSFLYARINRGYPEPGVTANENTAEAICIACHGLTLTYS